jgi:hypothetical protein
MDTTLSSNKKRGKSANKKQGRAEVRVRKSKSASSEPQKSWYDLAVESGLIRSLKSAPPDLSTNKKYMKDFGQS